MKRYNFLTEKIIYFSILVIILLLLPSCTRQYTGSGNVFNNHWPFYSNYEIQFPEFPFKKGTMNQQYSFQGICSCGLILKMYFLDDSGKQINFLGSKPRPRYIAELDLNVKLLEDSRILFERESSFDEDWILSGNFYWHFNFGDNGRVNFKNRAKYDLFLTIESKFEPQEAELNEPKAVKIQAALAVN